MNYKDKYSDIKIYGYCSGYFGRDSYGDKVIIASGINWVVARELDRYDVVVLAVFDDEKEMEEEIKEWSKEEF